MPSVQALPIFYGDRWRSIEGVMRFPDDLEMARHHVAAYHLEDDPSITTDLKVDTLAAMRPLARSRRFEGDCVGEIVKVLLTLIHCHSDKASWRSAIRLTANYAANHSGCGSSTSLYSKRLSLCAPVLHFWGARACRHRALRLDDPSVGYSIEDDAHAFVTEAQNVRDYLLAWNGCRVGAEQSTYLSANAFGPWAGCPPYEPRAGWRSGEVQAFGPLDDNVLLQLDGAPVIKPRGWQKGRPRILAQ
jgi:hypothetical protein